MSSILPYHLNQLSALCAAHPVEAKVVFVPSLQIGYNLGNALAGAGCAWVNLHLTTPLDWARRLAAPHLKAEGWRPLVQDADLFFVYERLQTVTWPEGHPFASSSEGVARSLLRSLHALRAAKCDPDRVSRAGLRNGDVVAELYRAYCDWMLDRRIYDGVRLFEAAATVHPPAETVYAVLDETSLTAAALRFVEALSGGAIVRIGRPAYEHPLPQESAGARFSARPLVNGGSGYVSPAVRLLSAGDVCIEDPPIALREAVGLENEVRGILREIVERGIALDEVEIAYSQEAPYLSLIVEAAERFGFPATFGAGVPVALTGPGQALLGFYRWIASGLDPVELRRLARSGFLSVRDEPVRGSDIAGVLEEARAGRGGWREAVERHVNWIAAEGGSKWRIERARTVGRVLDRLYELVPCSRSFRELCGAGQAFVERFAPVRTERDKRAAESLSDRLHDLGMEAEGEAAAHTLLDLVVEHKVKAAVARPGCLYVVPLNRAGYSGRPHLVIVGMAEANFPGAAGEDPMLLDDERRALGLPLERGRVSEAAWNLLRAVAMASGQITLVSNRRSIADGRETYPCALFQQVREKLKEVTTFLPVPEPAFALDESELVLAVRHQPGVREVVESDRPWLAMGALAERERRAPGIGRFDGWLGRRVPGLRPGPGDVVSVSRLEDLTACPYRYFLKHVLRVRPPDVPEDVPGGWLSALEFGSLLHAILRAFMEIVSDRGERVDAAAHAVLLAEVTARHVEAQRERTPVLHEPGFRVDFMRLERALRIFIKEESRRTAVPVGFEVSFGMGRAGGLSREEPVRLKLSERFELLLRGSIDRVDRTDEGFEVWDYKSGSTFDYDEFDLLMRGRRLQWALYAHVLDELLEGKGGVARTMRSGYFFTSDREHGLRLAQAPPDRSAVARVLEPMFEMLEEGAFPHVQKSDACRFCDYRGICAAERRGANDMEEIRAATDFGFMGALNRWMEI